jgi:hypothetical protein
MVSKVKEIINSFRSMLFPDFYGEGMTEELLYAQLCRVIDKDKAREMTAFLPELKELLAVATPTTFGPAILRAETAAIFGVSVLSSVLR